jgi:nucleotide-binding universal stress UspA family protein
MFSNILIPLDGTAESNVAIPAARTIAHATNAATTLLRVLPPPYMPGDIPSQTAMAELERIAAELRADGTSVNLLVRGGDPADEILRSAADEGSDLIVMRTHGRSGIGRAILGSVAEKVLSRSPVPVMLVRPGGRRLNALRTLLVPVDGSPGGSIALGTAVGLATATGAALELVEVVVPITQYMQGDFGWGGAAYVDPAWDDEAQASAQAYINGVASRLRTAGLSVHTSVEFEPFVARVIVSHAESVGADMIVMSTQALTGPARALLGSVADDVVRHAHCPVLLLHRPVDVASEAPEQAPSDGAAIPALG